MVSAIHGSARFAYTVADPDGASAPGSVAVSVRPVNDQPVARDRAAQTDEDGELQLQLHATDVDDERLEFSVTDRPQDGSVRCSSSGTCVYTPAADFSGQDSFAYRVDDGHAGAGSTATVTITVAPVNDRPSADAGGGYEADEGGSTVLDASLSSDRDGDALRYAWDLDGDGTHESPGRSPRFDAAQLDDGDHEVELKACDPADACDVATAVVRVRNVAPTVAAGADQTVYRNEVVELTGSWSDPAKALDAPYAWTWTVPGDPSSGTASYGTPLDRTASLRTEGVYTASLGVRDDDGASGSDDVVITVLNHNPSCAAAVPSETDLWPPNHQFVPITIRGVSDAEGDTLKLTVTGIRQDEPVNTNGDGSTGPDGKGVGTATAEVRAERSGTPKVPGDGRVYQIAFRATDGHGGECSGTVKVAVRHDQKTKAVDGGALHDSTKP